MRVLLVLLLSVCSLAQAVVIIQDDFEDGIDTANDWNPKWQSGTDQQDLFVADNAGYAKLDTSVAIRNYHIDNKSGFSLADGESATIGFDMRFIHNGTGNAPAQANKIFISPQFDDTPTWWNGAYETKGDVMRNNAIGLNHPASPWVEGWVSQSFGASVTTSAWYYIESTISADGGTYKFDTDLYNADRTTLRVDGTSYDTGVATNTTIYGGLTTAWQTTTDTIESITNVREVHIDNYLVETSVVIPEPATIGMVLAFGGAGIFVRRRFMI